MRLAMTRCRKTPFPSCVCTSYSHIYSLCEFNEQINKNKKRAANVYSIGQQETRCALVFGENRCFVLASVLPAGRPLARTGKDQLQPNLRPVQVRQQQSEAVARLSTLDQLASQDGRQEGAGVLQWVSVEFVTVDTAPAMAHRAAWQERGLFGRGARIAT